MHWKYNRGFSSSLSIHHERCQAFVVGKVEAIFARNKIRHAKSIQRKKGRKNDEWELNYCMEEENMYNIKVLLPKKHFQVVINHQASFMNNTFCIIITFIPNELLWLLYVSRNISPAVSLNYKFLFTIHLRLVLGHRHTRTIHKFVYIESCVTFLNDRAFVIKIKLFAYHLFDGIVYYVLSNLDNRKVINKHDYLPSCITNTLCSILMENPIKCSCSCSSLLCSIYSLSEPGK